MRSIKIACCLVPFILLFLNFGLCDQSRNYTAYEHAVNIFRTLGHGDILLLEGDNNFFPVVYGRMSEKMREDVILYDRLDILFRIPYLGESAGSFYGKWEEFRNIREQKLLEKYVPYGIYYATLRPDDITMPDGYSLLPYSLLHRAYKKDGDKGDSKTENLWKYYSKESFYDYFERDYLNRRLCSHFLLRYGQYLFMRGDRAKGLIHVQNAARLGNSDTGIHFDIRDFIREHGLK